MEHTEILLVAFALAGLTYYLAGLMMTLPKEEWVAWGYTMRNDSIIAMVSIGSVSAIQVLLEFVQNMISESTGSALILPNQAITSILAQLVTLDVALVGIVAIVSAVPFLAGFSIVLGHITGPAISTVTGSILLWTSVQLFTQAIPTLFLTLFSIGLVMWSLPFRIGRSAGSTMMALSMVLFVGLPLAAPSAVWIQGQVINSGEMDQLIKTIQSLDPNIITSHFATDFIIKRLAEQLTRVIGGIIIAYIIFPILYFALLALFTKAIANLIGGSARLISFGRLGLHG
jgi:hypothetical protein